MLVKILELADGGKYGPFRKSAFRVPSTSPCKAAIIHKLTTYFIERMTVSPISVLPTFIYLILVSNSFAKDLETWENSDFVCVACPLLRNQS